MWLDHSSHTTNDTLMSLLGIWSGIGNFVQLYVQVFSWALVCSDSLRFSVSCVLSPELIWIPSRSPSWWGCSILGLLSDIHILMGSPCFSYCVGMLLPPLHAQWAPKSHWPNASKQCQILLGLVSSRMLLCAQGFAHKRAELPDENGGLIHWWAAHSLHVNRDVEGAARTL